MHAFHHPIFVVLSILIAWLGSWTALDLFRRVRAHVGRWQHAWLAAAAIAMGLSIWSMHFIAMLGFSPGSEVRYDIRLTVVSLVLAIAATAFAFFSARQRGFRRQLFSGFVMGAGICTMHYVGMAALITGVGLSNDPLYVVLSFLIAVSASTGALVVAAKPTTSRQRAFGAMVLGFAIVGMHYCAMFGVRILPDAVARVEPSGIDSIVLAIAVAAGTLFILLLTLIAALSDRRMEAIALRAALRSEQEAATSRQAHRDLERLNELLEQRVTAAIAEKAEAEAALMHAQRLDALGRLTGGVAHDFNNLLTVIIGALDIILRHPENAERRKRLGEAALAAARRGERLTAQLLAFARRQPLQPQSCDLNELIRESEPLLRRVTGEALSLKFSLCPDDAIALIDPAQFEASLLNLLVNAADASSAGGEIIVETHLCQVAAGELPNLAPGQYFRMQVSDRGDGMSQAILSRIFEPFFTTKPPGKGTGLGLSQVYGFVRQSGGEVRVDSKQGEGTRFRVYLPIGAEQPSALPAEQPVTETDEQALRILLTEDDPTVAGVAAVMLSDLGHQVRRAANAEEALEILRSDAEIDLLLSDVVMSGGMNGVELAKQAIDMRPRVKILLSSGYAGEALDPSLARGAWPFLRKPYLASELAHALANLRPDAQYDEDATRLHG